MRKLISITILFLGFINCSPQLNYIPISDYDVKSKFDKAVDTLNDYRNSRLFKTIKTADKEKIKNRILERKKDIESDSTLLTKIYYFGKKENVGLKINGKLLKPTSSLAAYEYESIYGDSIFKINLGTIPRYSKIRRPKLLFNDLKRVADIKIDTKYSLIYIEVGFIENRTEILEREKTVNDNRKKAYELDKTIETPDFIEVIEKEEVMIYHKIPKRKHGW